MVGDFDDAIKAPLVVKGISTFYNNETGQASRTWVKTDVDKNEQLKQILASVDASITSYRPIKPVKAPTKTLKDILTVYPMGDPI